MIPLANRLRAAVLLSAAVFSLPALALDTREVIIGRQADLAISPEHMGQVLAEPNRDFALPYAQSPGNWWVFERAHAKVTWADRSYLTDPSNGKILRTYFEFDRDEPIDASAVLDLLKITQSLDLHYLVVGHADEVGTDSYNMALSIRRANSVRRLLEDNGIKASSIKAIGKGNHIPASLRDQSLNRRVEVIVRGNKQQRDKLKKAINAAAQQAQQEKAARDARERARQASLRSSYDSALHRQHGAGRLDSQDQKSGAVGGVAPAAATPSSKSLLPPVRESQMGGLGSGNPLEPIHNTHGAALQ